MNDVPTTGITRVCATCQQVYGYKDTHTCPKGGQVEPPQDPLVGATIGGRYLIESFLSAGGMGVVYRAKHSVLGKPVAIKLLKEAQDPMMQQRFLLEAKSACHIGHENIVDITDFGVLHDGRPYLVMEFLQGQSLEAIIAKNPLPPVRAVRIAEQIARGLYAVHEKGIIHRDLKPGNIFILERGRRDFVKILDFGIAKVMEGTRESLSGEGSGLPNLRATATGMVLGTPEYLSPEQGAGEAIDQRVDQYALGCIMYEMLTGHVPFQGNGPMSTLMKHLTEKPVPPRKKRPDLNISEQLEKIVLKAMAQQKQNRFSTMEELGNELQNLLESGVLPPDPISPSSISVPQPASTPRAAVPDLAPFTSGDSFAPTLQAPIPSQKDIDQAKGRFKAEAEPTQAQPRPKAQDKTTPANDNKPILPTERVKPISLSSKNRGPFLLLALAVAMVLVLALVLFVKLRSSRTIEQPDQAATPDGSQNQLGQTNPDPSEAVEREVILENKTSAKVTIRCGEKKSCVLDLGKQCKLQLAGEATCVASALGFVERRYPVAQPDGKTENPVHLLLQLEAEKTAKGKKNGKGGKGKKR